jgi:hypothetical protein
MATSTWTTTATSVAGVSTRGQRSRTSIDGSSKRVATCITYTARVLRRTTTCAPVRRIDSRGSTLENPDAVLVGTATTKSEFQCSETISESIMGMLCGASCTTYAE